MSLGRAYLEVGSILQRSSPDKLFIGYSPSPPHFPSAWIDTNRPNIVCLLAHLERIANSKLFNGRRKIASATSVTGSHCS